MSWKIKTQGEPLPVCSCGGKVVRITSTEATCSDCLTAWELVNDGLATGYR